jgi:hypothetical protein
MRKRQVILAAVAALSFALACSSREAKACSGGVCTTRDFPAEGWLVPTGGVIPVPRAVGHGVDGSWTKANGPWVVTDANGSLVATDTVFGSVDDELTPHAPLAPGLYTLRGTFGCSQTQAVSTSFNVTASTSTVVRVTGDVTHVEIAKTTMPAPEGGCTLVDGVTAHLAITASPELTAVASVARLEATLDCKPITMTSYGEAAKGITMTLPCTDVGAGTHEITVRAHVAGATADPAPVTVAVDLACSPTDPKYDGAPSIRPTSCALDRPVVDPNAPVPDSVSPPVSASPVEPSAPSASAPSATAGAAGDEAQHTRGCAMAPRRLPDAVVLVLAALALAMLSLRRVRGCQRVIERG